MTLLGRRSSELLGYPGVVCVAGTRKLLPLSGDSIVITRYRLAGDGKHAPIAGMVDRAGGRIVLTDSGGHRFVLRGTALERLSGRRAYVYGRWRDGAIDVSSFGLLGP